MLKRNSINVHSNTPQLATGCPYRWFWNFFSGFPKSALVLRSSWILNECNLYFKIVKYCILSEVCMIKTAPHSTVSPQVMYKKYKRLVYTPIDLLARFCKDFGFQKRAVQLLYSYLHDRKYSVKLGSHVSTCRHVERSAVAIPRAPPLVRCCGISFRTIWTICLTA